MNPRRRLASNLESESTAYGYTLTIWGAGALLIHLVGEPNVLEVFLYTGGGLAGFALMTLVAFDQPLSETNVDADPDLVAASSVHVGGTFLNLLVVYGVILAFRRVGGSALVLYPLVGLLATILYNCLCLLEELVSIALPPSHDDSTES